MILPSPGFTPEQSFFASSAHAFLPEWRPRPLSSDPVPALPDDSDDAAGGSWLGCGEESAPAQTDPYSPERPITDPVQKTTNMARRR